MKDHIHICAATDAVILWATLATWRETVTAHLGQVEKQALRHYATLASESSEPLHPVRWGDRVLVPKHEDDQRKYAETYLAARSPLERAWMVGGDVLGRVPATIFHGGFALAVVGLVECARRRAA